MGANGTEETSTAEERHRLEQFCRLFVCLLFLLMFGYIWFSSIRWTQLNFFEDAGIYSSVWIPFVLDGVKPNLRFELLAIVILLAGISGFSFLTRRKPSFHASLSLWSVSVLAVLFCLVYLRNLGTTGYEDDNILLSYAKDYLRQDVSSFRPGGYMANYPQQTTLFFFYTLLISIVGEGASMSVFRILNAFCVGVIIFSAGTCVRILWDASSALSYYLILASCCLPMLFYTGYAYGDLISLALFLPAAALTLKIIKQGRLSRKNAGGGVPIFLLCALASGFRSNTLILLIALSITVLISSMRRHQQSLLVLVPVLLVSGLVLNPLLRNTVYGGIEKGDSYPAICWVNIGLHYGGSFGIGAYDGMIYQLFEASGFQKELVAKRSREMIREQLVHFTQDKQAGYQFFSTKLRWQWIDPTYQCFLHSGSHLEGYPRGFVYQIFYGAFRSPVFRFMNHYQSLVYLLAILGTLGMLRRGQPFSGMFWSIYLIGGFLFSLIWEAKPRYVLPYLICMLPVCAYGLSWMESVFRQILRKIIRRTGKDNQK